MKASSFFAAAKLLLCAKYFKARVPLFASWALTYRCNLGCKYCGYKTQNCPELTTGQICAILEEMRKAKTAFISFTGGEPLMRDDIGAIIGHAKQNGFFVNLNTNGTLVVEKIEEIRRVDRVQLSLDGEEADNDGARGGGVYKQVLAALSLLKKVKIRTIIQAVLSDFNLDSVGFICELSKRFQTPVNFQPAKQKLLGSLLVNPHVPQQDQYRRVIDAIMLKKKEGYCISNSLLGLRHLRCYPEPKETKCMAGILSCDIEPDGSMSACDRYPYEQREINILKAGFSNAFYALRPITCGQCWCASQVEFNYCASLDIKAILNLLRSRFL